MTEDIKKVAVLGPEGTYSEMVARKHYGENVDIVLTEGKTSLDAIHNIIDSVVTGEVDYGVVPIEDSVEGAVSGNFELYRTHDIYITKQFKLDVVHSLLGIGEEKDLTTIVSHDQALKHCKRFLDKNFPDLIIKPVESTAKAAKIAAADPHYGAIANKVNIKIHPNLKILRDNIHDYGKNETGFHHIGPNLEISEDADTTEVLMYPKTDHPGLLLNMLNKISEKNINLSKIVSYPSKGFLGEYIFDVKFDHKLDSLLKSGLDEIEESGETEYIRMLGSFSTYDYTMKSSEPPLKLPLDTIDVEGNTMKIDASALDIGIDYSIKYMGGNIIIRRPKGGVLQLFEEAS